MMKPSSESEREIYIYKGVTLTLELHEVVRERSGLGEEVMTHVSTVILGNKLVAANLVTKVAR